jgi:hypothetical protein
MAQIVTEDPTFDNSTALPQRGNDGDDIFMDGGSAPQWPLWQRLYDRTAFALLGVSGTLVWSGDFGVRTGGSNAAFTLDIGAIQSLVLVAEDGSSYDAYFYAGGTITQAKVLGGGNLANSTWYYVFAKPGGGGICDFEITTVAPRTNRVFKTGSGFAFQSRRYLGCFPTDSSGNPIALKATRGRYLYRDTDVNAAPFASGSTSATWDTPVSLAPMIPPHANFVTLWTDTKRTSGTGSCTGFVRVVGDTNPCVRHGMTTASAFDVMLTRDTLVLGSTQEVELQTGDTNSTIKFVVAGFEE